MTEQECRAKCELLAPMGDVVAKMYLRLLSERDDLKSLVFNLGLSDNIVKKLSPEMKGLFIRVMKEVDSLIVPKGYYLVEDADGERLVKKDKDEMPQV